LTDIANKAALADFVKDIDRVEQLLELIQVFRDFAGQDTELPEYARDLWITAQNVRTDLPILSGSLLLYLCGRFEYFVRELVSTIVDDLVDRASRYDDLPEPLRRECLARTLSINQSPIKYNYTPTTASVLAGQLANNLSGQNDRDSSLQVDANIITITEVNMRPNVLADLFKRVAIERTWDTLAQQLPLQIYLGERNERDCKKAAMTRLDDIMTERNRIAHPTGTTAFPDAKSVGEMAEYFRVLAEVLVNLARLKTMPTTDSP